MKFVRIKVSVGEFLDKLSILYIKRDRIIDSKRLAHIRAEIVELEGSLERAPAVASWLAELVAVNTILWDCNERRKALLLAHDLGQEYLDLTVQESQINDSRFRIKARINAACDSAFREQKSYAWTRIA